MRAKHTLVALVLILAAFGDYLAAQAPNARQSKAGEILVKFRPGVLAAAKADAHRMGGGAALAEIARTHVQLVSVPPGAETAAIARYSQNPNVLYAEPNFIRRIPELTTHSGGTEVVPGDHYFDEQWALHNTGQEFYCIPWIFGDLCLYIGTPDADIDAPEAWAISTGVSTSIKVAVIDSGIDYNHPDLAANFAGGADFTSPDGDPMDDHGHGTHVAGTIAAAMNNLTGDPPAEEGVAGVAPNALILAYKVCIADGTCDDFAIQQGIAQAIIDGAKVINMSLGAPEFSQSVSDAVQDAWNAGIVIVAAAGNDGTTAEFYPAAYDNVISVAAFDEDHRRASFSNYGNWVDISAPGNVIMSAYPLWGCEIGTAPGDIGCYTWNSGTSMASPHVAGAAALVWSRGDVTTNAQVKDILLNSADPRGVDSVRLDSWTHHGGLNLHNAMSFATTNQNPTAGAGGDQTVTDNDLDGVVLVTLDGSASTDPDGSIASYEWREGATAIAFGVTPTVSLAVGVHTLTLLVTDQYGATDTDEVVITVRPGNAPPTATNSSATTTVGTPVTIVLRATDMDTCDLVFAIVQGPASGTLSAIQPDACVAGSPNTDTARVTFTPGSTAGTFSFTFSANDGSLVSNTATATITVDSAPPVSTLTVTGINPNTVSQNVGTRTFIISGTGFAIGARLSFANGTGGSAPRVISVVRDSSTQLTASVEIKAGGPRKNRQWDVVVTNPDGTSFAGVRMLTITP
jgi:thermitase